MSTVYANIDGFVGFNGQSRHLAKGDPYGSDDPIVQAMPQHFTTVEPGVAVVEREKGGSRGRGRE